jgi:hypothetical protein
MTPIDQIRPPNPLPPATPVKRKQRSARDSNRDKRSGQQGPGKEKKKPSTEHIDKLI